MSNEVVAVTGETRQDGPETPLRLFVACRLPDAWILELGRRQQQLRHRLGSASTAVRWTRPENAHLTLLFLGSTPPEREGLVRRAVEAAAGSAEPFTLRLHGCGTFGGRRPRVLWVAPAGELVQLASLQRQIADGLGHASTEEYRPHITLGRVDWTKVSRAAAAPLAVAISGAMSEPYVDRGEAHQFTEIALMQSELRSDGARYLVRFVAFLRSA